jgi:hypothetical protein
MNENEGGIEQRMTSVTTLTGQEKMEGRVQLVSDPNLGPVFTTINEGVKAMGCKVMRQTRAVRNYILTIVVFSNENEEEDN